MSRPHKYGARPTTVDNIRFASQREAARYGELKLLLRAGEIRDLEMQPAYPLLASVPPGDLRSLPPVHVAIYRGDFRYVTKDGETVVEDVKGVATSLYKLKRKIVEANYGIRITEVL